MTPRKPLLSPVGIALMNREGVVSGWELPMNIIGYNWGGRCMNKYC